MVIGLLTSHGGSAPPSVPSTATAGWTSTRVAELGLKVDGQVGRKKGAAACVAKHIASELPWDDWNALDSAARAALLRQVEDDC